MNPNSSQSADLFLPLLEGMFETPPWTEFMTALLAKTQARRGLLLISQANAPADHQPTILQLAAPRAVRQDNIDVVRLMSLGLHPYASLRPGRVYAIDEMLNFNDRRVIAHQRAALDAMGIRFGRWLRISADGIADAWILLTREREDFSASAVATLSNTGPYLRAALRAFVTLSEQRLLRIMSQSALERLGIGQIALDENGHVMAADDTAKRHLSFTEGTDRQPRPRLQLPPASARLVERACAEFAETGHDPAARILIDAGDDLMLMLQPAPFAPMPGITHPVAVATLRVPAREDERLGAAILRDQYGLSSREASLAQRLSRGDLITEGGRRLHLTQETARNYSKRIYARTGSRGQADLVRKILCGLAPLA